jgi:dipeptidyl-peptidase-4
MIAIDPGEPLAAFPSKSRFVPTGENALSSGRYDHVERNNGEIENASALTDAHEYFAKGTEAYYGRNDFYPFDRHDLETHDPELDRLTGQVCGL